MLLAKSSLDDEPAAARLSCAQMAVVRTIFALLLAVSVAMLPAAGAFAFKAEVQAAAEMSAQMSADGMTHDCCPPAVNPCDKAGDGCASMAACALPCCVYPAAVAAPLVYPTMFADLMPLLRSKVLSSQLGSPPFRPPRV
jgi:hypothetical protein